VVTHHPVVLVVGRVGQPAVGAGGVQPDDAGLTVAGDRLGNGRQVGVGVHDDGVVGHPGPAGVLRVVGVALGGGVGALEVEGVRVVDVAEEDLGRAAHVAGHDAHTDEVADVGDVAGGQGLSTAAVQHLAHRRVQAVQRLRAGGGTAEGLD